MSGSYRGKIECVVVSNSRETMTQVVFKNIYDFFINHPNYTLIALNYGSASGPGTNAGTGTGYFDQGPSFGYNAWFVVRATATAARPYDVYHLFQWAGATNDGAGIVFGQSPGAPALVNGVTALSANNTAIGYQFAIGLGGSGGTTLSPGNGNPWKGTSNANGSDTKPSTGPIWGAPAGGGTGVIISPRSNDGIGSFRQQTQNCGAIYTTSNITNQQTRHHIIGDDDSFVFAYDATDNGNYTMSYSGLYTPRSNVTITYPYCSVLTTTALPWSVAAGSAAVTNVYGDVAGTQTNQGGIVQLITSSLGAMQLDHYSIFATDGNFWPDKQFSSPTFNELDIPVGVYEVAPLNAAGLLGQLDFIREMFNVETNGVKSDFSRIFLGSTTIADRKYSVPWDAQNNTVPRSGTNRVGTTFVTTI